MSASQDDPRSLMRRRSVALPGTPGHRIWLDRNGRLATDESDVDMDGLGARSPRIGTTRLTTRHSGERINDWLEDNNAFLRPGEGRAVIGYKKVPLERNYDGIPGFTKGSMPAEILEASETYLPVYGEVGGNRGGGGGGEASTSGGARRAPSRGQGRPAADYTRPTRQARVLSDIGVFDVDSRGPTPPPQPPPQPSALPSSGGGQPEPAPGFVIPEYESPFARPAGGTSTDALVSTPLTEGDPEVSSFLESDPMASAFSQGSAAGGPFAASEDFRRRLAAVFV